MAKLIKNSIVIPFDYSDGWQDREKTAITAAAEDARSKASGDLVGEILRWQRADGYACYMVVKQRPLTIQHMSIGDGWRIEDPLIRGLNLTDVREMVRRERGLRELFGQTE